MISDTEDFNRRGNKLLDFLKETTIISWEHGVSVKELFPIFQKEFANEYVLRSQLELCNMYDREAERTRLIPIHPVYRGIVDRSQWLPLPEPVLLEYQDILEAQSMNLLEPAKVIHAHQREIKLAEEKMCRTEGRDLESEAKSSEGDIKEEKYPVPAPSQEDAPDFDLDALNEVGDIPENYVSLLDDISGLMFEMDKAAAAKYEEELRKMHAKMLKEVPKKRKAEEEKSARPTALSRRSKKCKKKK